MRLSPWVLLCFLAACESSSIGNDTPDGPGGGFFDGPLSTADARVNCVRASDCGGTRICDPSTDMCVPSLSCTGHAQCGGGAYCNGGTCAPNTQRGQCEINENCVGQEHCTDGRCGCGGEALGTVAVPPNMRIALDRSGSMVSNTVPGSGTPARTRWDVAKSAIAALTAAPEAANIRFGLTLWPGTDADCNGQSCQGTYSPVAIGGTATQIANALNGADTCSLGTPITGTLNAIAANAADLGLADTTRENYVVFVTDGQQQNCSGNEANAVTALRNRTPTVRTFVVGFSGDVDTAALTAMATAGGTARPGTPNYYQANNEQDLIDAFEDIAGNVASCDHMLTVEPEAPDRLFVFVGDTELPRDPTRTNGWEYDSATRRLTFYGAACNTVRGGGELVVALACPILP
jgi:hypothetical protein